MRVLVVDDNEDSVRTMAQTLRMLGHEVRTAHDGEQAVLEASAFHPRLVLLDITMAGMDGYGACSFIRSALSGQVHIVAVTGLDGEAHRLRAAEAGFDGHLTKPVEWLLLLRVIHGVQVHPPG